MELSDRKKRILYAIITDYVNTAEPVGSKTITEKYGLGFSSATIRNEMAELEEMGYIIQPHTSAGRVPTEKGYRLFVNSLMNQYKLSAMEMQRINMMLQQRVTQLEKLISDVGKQISSLMQLPTVAVTPKLNKNEIKRFDFIPIDLYSFVMIIVTNGGIVKNKVFRSNVPIDEEILFEIGIIMNRNLTGIPIENIDKGLITRVYRELMAYGFVLQPIVDFITESLNEVDNAEVFLDGTANILEYPEFQDTNKIKNIFSLLDDKEELKSMLTQISKQSDDELKIVIGRENPHVKMQDSSIVIGNYKIGDKIVGAIGVIGPTRMNYSKVSAHLEYFTKELNRLLKETFFSED